MQTGEITNFDMKFFATVLMAFAAALTPSMLFFPVIMGMIPEDYALMGTPFIFLFVVIAAYGANDIINKGVSFVGSKVGAQANKQVVLVDVDQLATKIVEKQRQNTQQNGAANVWSTTKQPDVYNVGNSSDWDICSTSKYYQKIPIIFFQFLKL